MPPLKPLRRAALDWALCSTPGCTHGSHTSGLHLHARCHPQAPLDAAYADGVLLVRCHQCDTPIVALAVAEGAP